MKKYQTTLLIDNDPVSNFLNYAILKRNNISKNIIMRGNGETALVFLHECLKENNKFPELILLSIHLPGMDGYQFLEEYEKFSLRRKKNTEVIIVSTICNSDKERLDKNGTAYIAKPLSSEALINIIKQNVSNEEYFT
jgi:CheY-like chemotaxis protein